MMHLPKKHMVSCFLLSFFLLCLYQLQLSNEVSPSFLAPQISSLLLSRSLNISAVTLPMPSVLPSDFPDRIYLGFLSSLYLKSLQSQCHFQCPDTSVRLRALCPAFFWVHHKSWISGEDQRVNRKAYPISHCQSVKASSPCMLGWEVIMLRALLSVSTLGVCNLGRGRGQGLVKSFGDAQYRSSNLEVSFCSHPSSLPEITKQNSVATSKATQIFALKPYNNSNSQPAHELHQSDSLQSIYVRHHCLGGAGLTMKFVVK